MKAATPFLKMYKLPSFEVMILNVVAKLGELDEDFYLNLEYLIVGVIEGEQDCEDELLRLIGAISNEHQNQPG